MVMHMQKREAIITIFIAVCLLIATICPVGAFSAPDSQGGIFNGGFETGTGTRTQAAVGWIGNESFGWYAYPFGTSAYAMFDANVSHSGSKSMKIYSADTSSGSYVVTLTGGVGHATPAVQKYGVPVKPNTNYVLTTWYKLSSVSTAEGGGLSLNADTITNSGTVDNASIFTLTVNGTKDWTPKTVYFTTSSSASKLYLVYLLTGCTGSAWVDDISLQEIVTDTTDISSIPQEWRPTLTANSSVDNKDQVQESYVSYLRVGNNTSNNQQALAQSFVPQRAKLTAIGLYKQDPGATLPKGDLWIGIYTNDTSTNAPSSVALATARVPNTTWSGLSVGLNNILLSANLVPGTKYWIVANTSQKEMTNTTYYALGYSNSASSYANGVGIYNSNNGAWAEFGGDLVFDTFYAKNSEDFTIIVNGIKRNYTVDSSGFLHHAQINLDSGNYTYLRDLSVNCGANDIYSANTGTTALITWGDPVGISGISIPNTGGSIMGYGYCPYYQIAFTNPNTVMTNLTWKVNTLYPVKSVSIKSRAYDSATTTQVSHDNITWTTIGTSTGSYTVNTFQTSILSGNRTFYVKVNDNSASYQVYSLQEIYADLDLSEVNQTQAYLFPINTAPQVDQSFGGTGAARVYFNTTSYANGNGVIMPALVFTDGSGTYISNYTAPFDNSQETNPAIKILSNSTGFQTFGGTGTPDGTTGYILNNEEYMVLAGTPTSGTITYKIGKGTTAFSNITQNTFYLSSNGASDNLALDPSHKMGVSTTNKSMVTTGETVDFSGTPLVGDVPLTVRFTDSSSGSVTSPYSGTAVSPAVLANNWNFGDGSTTNNTATNPVHTFTTPSSAFGVTLNKIWYGYNLKSVTKTNYVTTSNALISSFTQNVTTGTAPATVLFTNTSTGSPTGWAWFFGDEPYTQPWVRQNASSGWVQRAAQSLTIHQDGSIILTGGYDGTGGRNDTWRSTDKGSTWTQTNTNPGWSQRWGHSTVTLSDGTILLFGGSSVGIKFNDTWKSIDKGVTWTLVNASSGWTARYYVASAVFTDDTILLMGGNDGIYKNDTWKSTDKGVTWTLVSASSGWQIRNGHTATVLPNGNLTITGGFDGTNYFNDTWVSTNKGTTWSKVNASSGWEARYGHNSIAMPDGSIVLIGGYDGTVKNDTWRSQNSGINWVRINASSGWESRYFPSSVGLPDGSIILTGGLTLYNDTWRFNPVGSTSQNPTHTYASTGNFPISLQVSNGGVFNLSTQKSWMNVSPAAAQASFTPVGTQTGNDALTLNFNDTSTDTPTTWNYTYQGISGGNTTKTVFSTARNTTATFGIGNFSIKLNTTSAGGFNESAQVTWINVSSSVSSLNTDFVANQTVNNIYPMAVQFSDLSTGSPTTWNWSFGNGRNSTSQNPLIYYNVAGKYPVFLNVTNATGAFNKTTKADYINLISDVDPYLKVWSHLNGTQGSTVIYDEMGVAWTAMSGAIITTSQSQFGNSSLDLTAAGSYVFTPSTTYLNNGGNDFTIELWLRPTTPSTGAAIVTRTSSGAYNNGWGFINTNGTQYGYSFFMGSSANATDGIYIPNNQWTFVAIERQSGTVRVYNNGMLNATKPGMAGGFDTANIVQAGWLGPGSNNKYTGYMDEVRYSGQKVRWPTNFNVPTAQYAGTLESYFTDINPDSTFRFKTDTGAVAIIANQTAGGVRNRTIQIENITHTDYIVGSMAYNPLHLSVKRLILNNSIFSGMTFESSSIDDSTGLATFNISRPGGFTTYGFNNRSSFLDAEMLYYNYTPEGTTSQSFFGQGMLINATVHQVYPIHNFISTALTYGGWDFFTGFTANNTNPQIYQPVLFTDTTVGYPNIWNVSFGDGTYADSLPATHSYSAAGTYYVTYNETIWQNLSVKNSSQMTIVVSVIPVPVTNFVVDHTTVVVGQTLQFNDTSTNSPISWQWDFGDGGFSYTQNPTYSYSTTGLKTVSLNATNLGGSNTMTKTNYITVNPAYPAPIANFTTSRQTEQIGGTIQFYDTTSNTPTAWAWNFGDGGTSTAKSPSHVYTAAGVYTVILTATNAYGSDTETKVDYITITTPYAPAADFTADTTNTYVGGAIHFTDTSLYSPSSWLWNFGDGIQSHSQNPTHVYTATGTYTVSLTATSIYGSDTETKTGYITISGAVPTTPPTGYVITKAATEVSNNTVTMNGFTTSTSYKYYFEYGYNPASYSYATSQKAGSDPMGNFSETVSGLPLMSDQKYYYRAVIVENENYINGNELDYTLTQSQPVDVYPEFESRGTQLIESGWDFDTLLRVIPSPFVDTMGAIFYGIIIGGAFILLWARTHKIIIPSLFGILSGGILWNVLPPEWVSFGSALFYISIGGFLYGIIVGRQS